ncbi:MAG: tetratricopeptide repeat protein [Candidatus Sericytochromatia bacterium]
MKRIGLLGLVCALALLTGAPAAVAQKRPQSSATPDATPMPLPRFYARHVEEGNKLLAQNRIAEALDEFFTARTINPDYAPTYIGMGQAYQKMGQLQRGMENYQVAVRLLNPSYASDHVMRGDYYADRNQYAQAMAQYWEVLRIDPAAGNQYTLAMRHLRFNDPKKAVKAFETAISIDEDYADPHFQLGNFYYVDNKMKKAIPSYEKAVALDTGNAVYRFALGTASYKEGTAKRKVDLKLVKAAASEFEQAQRLGMQSARLNHNLGTAYILTGNYSGAVRQLQQAVRGGLQDGDTFHNLGNAFYRQAMLSNFKWDGYDSLSTGNKLQQNDTKFKALLQAAKSYEIAAQKKEDDAALYYDMGAVYYRLSELKLTPQFIPEILKNPATQKDYSTRGVRFFMVDMLQHSKDNFNRFLSASSDAKMKNAASKIISDIDTQLAGVR